MRRLLAKSLLYLFGALPLALTHAIGAALGRLFAVIPNRRLRTAQTNLQLCFPDMAPAARQQLLRRVLIEVGKSVLETGALWTRNKAQMTRLVRRTHGEEHVQRALQNGQGVIIAAPHLGAWEMVGCYCSMRYPMTSMYQPPKNSVLGDFIRRARERFGARLVPTDTHGIRALYQALDRGELVGMLPDQVPAQRGSAVFAPFFGIPASTMVLLSRLAIKSKAVVVFTYAERLSNSQYDLHFVPAPPQINQGDVESSAAVVNRMVEHCARAVPEQYQWIYKRFRVRPPGERAFY